MLCHWVSSTDILKECMTLNMKTLWSFWMSRTTHPVTIFIPRRHILSSTAWRKLNLATGSFVKCLLYKEGSCDELEFSKNFVSCNQVLIDSNMTLLDRLFNFWCCYFRNLFYSFLVPIHLTYSTAYRIL